MSIKDKARLQHILESIELIEEYLEGVDEVSFSRNRQLQDAINRRIEIIGEAVKSISKSLKEKYPNVPWQTVSDMRNKLIHEYHGLDMEMVWQTSQDDIPILRLQIENILEEINNPPQ